MAELIVYEDVNIPNSRVFELVMPRLLIGSSPDNELVLSNNRVAPAHVSLELRYNYWVLQDLGSEPCTLVNGLAIHTPHVLEHQDVIEIGSVRLEFHHEALNKADDTHPTLPIATPAMHVDDATLGRVWLIKVMSATLFIIMVIVGILVYLGVVQVSDLLDLNTLPLFHLQGLV